MVADLVRYLIAAGLTFVMGVIIGYRPGGGVLGVVILGLIVYAGYQTWAATMSSAGTTSCGRVIWCRALPRCWRQ